MPFSASLRRALAAALTTIVLLTGAAGPAAALEPPRPLPGYRPAFVTETDTSPWQDCLWASGAMLLDKWTGGEVQLTRQKLRALSGDRQGGSTLAALQAAYAKVGITLRYSPNGGARITWSQLLSHLQKGAGAVLLGDDSKLPRWYGRWDVPFWKATGEGDNHAVYIERYDRSRGRVWLMDPLGQGDWRGEWISVAALRKYAWTSGGALSVAVTPAAAAAPYAGVTVGSPAAGVTTTTVDIAWPVTSPQGWHFPGADVAATFTPAADPLTAAATEPIARPLAAADAPLAAPVASVTASTLHAAAPLPVEPGAYQATIVVTDRRFGRVVASSTGTAVYVPGPRSAALSVRAAETGAVAGMPIAVTVSVANTGELTWAEGLPTANSPMLVVMPRDTRLVARWVPVDVPSPAGPAADPATGGTPPPQAPAIPVPVELSRLRLAPGRLVRIDADVVAPSTAGTWALVVDVMDDIDGSFAALGSAPAVQVFQVAAAPVLDGLE